MAGRVLVGISGWAYKSWRGDFYPVGLRPSQQLAYVSERLATVEINASFYSLRRPSVYQRWHDETPQGFLFAVKGGRYITHIKRLSDAQVPLANFLASGVLALDDKLGPLLWQLPASLPFDADTLARFLSCLPADTAEATRLAAFHGPVLEGRAWLEERPIRPIRHALEARHDSFKSPGCLALLRAHGVALVFADSAGTWPMLDEATTDFRYVRLHGHQKLYAGGYEDAALLPWADRMRAWSGDGQDVYAYFDNDADGRAPFDAQRLRQLLDGP
jgi:uncharacterized protein YecE (DUF72 family)